MRKMMVLFLLLFALRGIGNAPVSSQDELSVLVKSLGMPRDVDKTVAVFDTLLKQPEKAAGLLIEELRPVPEYVIGPHEVPQRKETMHVIWCIRALRYITNGLDLKGETREKPKDEWHQYLWQFAEGTKKNKVPFFAVWMSRDITYIAPQDAQKEIIRKWKEWYKKEGKRFPYKRLGSLTRWYF